MKSVFSGILSVFLSVVILILPLTVAASAEESVQKVPNIYVHGFMASEILENPDDPDSEAVWPPQKDNILKGVQDAILPLVKFALTRDWDTFASESGAAALEIFGKAVVNPDGTVTDGSGVRFEYPEPETITPESQLSFVYDWRGDPVEIAGQLNDFVDYVTECSGCDTVTITCHSLGGVITISYLTIYGIDKVSGVCFNANAINGETYNGELMTGNLRLNAETIYDYMRFNYGGTEYENLFAGLVELLYRSGLFDILVNIGNGLLDKMLTIAARDSIVPLFGGWLGIWAMVPDEYIDDAVSYVFDGLYSTSDIDYSVLRAKVDRYNELVRPYKAETLRKLNEKAHVYVISRYGYSTLPLTESHEPMTDGTIDVKYSSFGATTAPYGETLSGEYLASADPAYVSPDKTIDASTCMFPEQTWFVRDMKHGGEPDSLYEMIFTLLNYDGQATVNTFARYPRFLKYIEMEDQLLPDTDYTAPDNSFINKMILMLRDVFTLISKLFEK